MAVAAVFALWTVGIEARLIYLQVVAHADLTARADRQQLDTIDVPAKRGEILDRHGRVLAYSVDADTVFANPLEVEGPDRTASLVCGALDACDNAMRQSMAKMLRKRTQFAYLARKISPEEASRVRALQLKGIAFLKENRRYYPKRELAAHVLGYVGTDNVGLAGLESTYDSQVRGKDGKVLVTADARQHALFSRVDRQATAGASLELTIDQYLQHIAERELRAGVEKNRAAGGSALIMDPRTGEILALANWPTFNPNTFLESHEQSRRNRAIQDLYEPGSTFKLVTASAALEENVISMRDPVDCSPGFIKFEGRPPIRDMHRYGVMPFTDVIVKSSNVGAIRVGLRLGPERLGRYVSRFGFGQPIAPDFRGENPGIVWNPAKLDSSALASVSMGYQVGVTPVQMAAAASSIANGGTLIEPRVVRAIIKDGRRSLVQPRSLRRTVSEKTVARAHRDHGRRRPARDREVRADSRLHHRRQDRNGGEADQRKVFAVRVQRLLHRIHSLSGSGADDHRRHRFAARWWLYGWCRRRARVQAHCRSVAPADRRRAKHRRAATGSRRPSRR